MQGNLRLNRDVLEHGACHLNRGGSFPNGLEVPQDILGHISSSASSTDPPGGLHPMSAWNTAFLHTLGPPGRPVEHVLTWMILDDDGVPDEGAEAIEIYPGA